MDAFEQFLEETDEFLDTIEIASSDLLNNPTDLSHINEIFRAAHSLKGNSSFFGLEDLRNFFHNFESFLDLIRGKSIPLDESILDLIIEGSDYLKEIGGRLRSDGLTTKTNDDEREYLGRINSIIAKIGSNTWIELLGKKVREFFKEHAEAATDLETDLGKLYKIINQNAPELLKESDKEKSSWIYNEIDISDQYNQLDEFLKSEDINQIPMIYDLFTETSSALVKLIGDQSAGAQFLNKMIEEFDTFYHDELGVDEILLDSLKSLFTKFSESGVKRLNPESSKEKKDTSANADEALKKNQDRQKKETGKAIKISEKLIDNLIDYVGELITVNELYNIIYKRVMSGDNTGIGTDLKNINHTLGDLGNKMQKALYEVRKVPFERAVSKFPSTVRVIAKNQKKLIKLIIKGKDVEIDKSILDKLETILGHAIRNSCDHGIEHPDERMANGKQREGTITIEAYEFENYGFISIEDDGRGVNPDKIVAKAIEKGFINSANVAKMSKSDILELMLMPGFSTASEVTETSGRGVGLDVIKASISDMGGLLSIVNKHPGLRIEMKIPLTYTSRIKLGLTLRLGDEIFLIPSDQIKATFKASDSDLNHLDNNEKLIKRWNNSYPLIDLGNILDIKRSNQSIDDSICMLVEWNSKEVCLVTDEIIGQRQIVYKQLNLRTREPFVFEGISILDGRSMALILSIEGIIKQYILS